MKLRRPRTGRKGRIDIIPMIDVIFFLLATFMLASLSMQNVNSLAVELPRGQAQPVHAAEPITLTITRDGLTLLNKTPVELGGLAETLKAMAPSPDPTVIVNADRAAPNGRVVEAMLEARKLRMMIATSWSSSGSPRRLIAMPTMPLSRPSSTADSTARSLTNSQRFGT